LQKNLRNFFCSNFFLLILDKQNTKKMAKIYHESQSYDDAVVDFEHMGEDYRWEGDYDVNEEGESDTYDCPGWSEQTVEVIHTKSLTKYDEEKDEWIDVRPTHSLLLAVELEIESQL